MPHHITVYRYSRCMETLEYGLLASSLGYDKPIPSWFSTGVGEKIAKIFRDDIVRICFV